MARTYSPGRPLAVGANHRSSSIALRDRLFIEDAAVPAFLKRLRKAGIPQALALSTCDRVEVLAIAPARRAPARGAPAREDGVEKRIMKIMALHAGLKPDDLQNQVYALWDKDAVRHIFTVASSLDSLMIGEPQVLGQMKNSYRLAQAAAMSGAQLEALMQAAFAAAKRVRGETAIGQRPVSMAAVAAQLAKDIHGDLSGCSGLLIGCGDMGELAAKALLSSGLGHLSVIHPAAARAEALALGLGCHVAPFTELAARMADADIVLTAMGSRHYLIGPDMAETSLRKRRNKPLFLVDASVPGDIDPAVNRIDDAFFYDLSDLERVAMEGREARESEVSGAMSIIEAGVESFMLGQAERAAVPALTLLRRHFEEARLAALRDAGDDAKKATHLLIKRLLHNPSKTLRGLAAGDALETAEQALNRLFNLDKN